MIELMIWDDPQTVRTRQYGSLDAAMAGIRSALEDGRAITVNAIRRPAAYDETQTP